LASISPHRKEYLFAKVKASKGEWRLPRMMMKGRSQKNCGLAKNMLQVLFSVRLRSARLWATTMNVRTRRPHLITSFLLGLALSCALAAPAAAQGGTPEQRAACEDDAMRLCGQ
jgi:hypothetical protein